jgi:tetratricopeptide (TPR) repeat protein
MALTLNLIDVGRPPRVFSRPVAAVLLVLAVAPLTLCYATAFRPVLRRAVLVDEGGRLAQQGRYERAAEAYRQAAQADPYSPQPWRLLANLAYHRWLERGLPRDLGQFGEFAREALSRDQRSKRFRRELGDRWLRAFRVSRQTKHIHLAVDAYRRALELHPNDSSMRAQWAWALRLAGEPEAAAQQAAEALRLDSLNPHSERKLASQQVYDGQQRGDRAAPLGAGNAEDLMQELCAARAER